MLDLRLKTSETTATVTVRTDQNDEEPSRTDKPCQDGKITARAIATIGKIRLKSGLSAELSTELGTVPNP